MRIELLTPQQYGRLMELYNNHPNLHLQNTGYEYLNQSKFDEKDKAAFEEVTEILKEHISGFEEFSNFRKGKKTDRPQIRFQYNWDYDSEGYFVGVGYIHIDELLNGFDEN